MGLRLLIVGRPWQPTHPLRRWPHPLTIYPLVFVVGVVLNTYVGTDYAVPAWSVLRPIALAGLSVVVVGVLLSFVIGWYRAALVVMLVPMFMMEVRPAPQAQGFIIAVPLLVGLTAELVGRRRGRDPWLPLTMYLGWISLALVAIAVVTWVSTGGLTQLTRDIGSLPPQEQAAEPRADQPSFYLLLLDAYPRADTLETHLGYDNPLIGRLEELGFDHYADSRSNYPNTTLTTASLLNMRHLDDLGLSDGDVVPAPRQPRFRNALAGPAAFELVREHGYETVVVESGWDELTPTGADRVIRTAGLTQFEEAVLRYSALAPIVDLAAPDIFGFTRRGRIEQALEAVAVEAESQSGAKLVWTHVPAPHFPLVYRSDGSPLLASREKLGWFDLEDPAMLDLYRGNLTHLNTLVVAAIERIVAADPEAVVVVVSDHGSLLELGGLEETVRNLTLARTPGHAGLLGREPTLVNLFPRLFNAYLDRDLELLPSDSWFVKVDAASGDWLLVSGGTAGGDVE